MGRWLEEWIDKVGRISLLVYVNLKVKKEMPPQSLPAVVAELAVTLPASQGSPGGLGDLLTSFTEMHMAQISTSILPKSCSHHILYPKGCDRACGGRERNGWVQDGE